MPYTPPCGDHEHASIMGPYALIREDVRIEEKDQSEAGVLYAGLYGHCPSVLIRKFQQCTCTETDAEGKDVVYKDDEENILDTLHESIEVSHEDDDDHCYENRNGKVLERFLQNLRYLREILSAEDSEHKRNTHDYHDALEDFPERNLKLRKLTDGPVVCKVEI